MGKASRIYVAGHRGLAGSAIMRELQCQGYTNLVVRTHTELDLEDAAATRRFFEQERPEIVFLAAAKVGGIHANNTYPADFLMSNLLIEANICRAAHATKVNRMIFLGSSCIYPRDCPQPIKEEYLLTGPLEATNRPYALAKIAGIEMCWSYNRQYGTKWLAAMPTNLYGPGDNYDLNNSHVLPALIRKIHLAKLAQQGDFAGIAHDEAIYGKIPDAQRAALGLIPQSPVPGPDLSESSSLSPASKSSVTLWGSGTPKREFLHVDDLAHALIFLATLDDTRYNALVEPSRCPLINVGSGDELTIRELAELIAKIASFQGNLVQDTSKPDGTMRKVLDVSKIQALGWRAKIPLTDGIFRTYQDYVLGIAE